MKRLACFLTILLISVATYAADIQPAFEALRGIPVDYSPTGQVCEQVARLQLSEKYLPGQYDIAVGVEYIVAGRTVGELDIVIVDKASQNVVLVGEVKCWRSMGGGLSKAQKQRARFVRTLQTQPDQIVYKAKEGANFVSEQFRGTKYVAIAQQGSVRAGFDLELNYSLQELMQLRGKLLDCQAQGQCPTP